MKKILLAIIVSSFLTGNLWAASMVGTVSKIAFLSDGRVYASLDVGGVLNGAFLSDAQSAETLKVFIAALMTAKASDISVKGYINDGVWTSFSLE